MILLGIDPGMAHCGIAILEGASPDHRDPFKLLDLSVYETKPGNFNERLAEHFRDMLPLVCGADAIAVEYPSYPKHASAAVKLFSSYVLITTMAKERAIPVYPFMPRVWRRRLDLPARPAGEERERKEDTAELCENTWSASRFLSKIKNAHEEHALDALGVATAWLTPGPSDEEKEIPDEGND